MWQALHAELESKGLTVVTVALDVNADDAKPWISAAAPTHPSLIDAMHITDELFGITNVPMAVWIDESGKLVRPAELASIEPRPDTGEPPEEYPDRIKQILRELTKFQGDPEGYLAAIHDWVEKGAESKFALSETEVIERSRPMPADHARAAACFELGRWHWENARSSEATDETRETSSAQSVKWWQEAHNLHPENWTYKRQAWTFVTSTPGQEPDLLQGPNDVYEGNWFDDLMNQGGGEAYYQAPAL